VSARAPIDAKRVRMLVTPEGVGLPLELADGGQRLGAFVIDMLIMTGVFVVFTLLLLAAGLAIGRPVAFRAMGVLWLAGAFFVRNFYFTWFEARPRGRTPGKRALGIRVIARHGGRLTLDSVIARNAMREVEIFLPLTFVAMGQGTGDGADTWLVVCGLIWSGTFLFLPLMNRDRLRAGDLLAGTWVIRVPRRPLLAELAADTDVETFTDAELDAYGVHELETLEGVIRQAHPPSVATVADTIARRIGRRHWSDDGGTRDLAFLQSYYAALRRRLEQRLLLGRRRVDKHDR
jgi:uncharacterized RDD family membrane protein YckC